MSEQLFSTRLPHFCPGSHCTKACGPSDCTCKPCGSGCEFCRDRRARPVLTIADVQQFAHRQLRLINDFTSTNQRS